MSVDVSTWSLVDEPVPARACARSRLTSSSRPSASRTRVGELDTRWVLKRGARRAHRRRRATIPRAAAQVVDTTGAGDALAAGFLVGGAELGLAAAAAAARKLGAMP